VALDRRTFLAAALLAGCAPAAARPKKPNPHWTSVSPSPSPSPTVSATVTRPTVTPSPSADPITHGSQLTTSNVGTLGGLSTYSGNYVATSGETIENLNITGELFLHGIGNPFDSRINVTVRNVRCRGINLGYGGSGHVIEDFEVDGGGTNDAPGIWGQGMSAVRRGLIHGTTNGVRFDGPGNVSLVYVYDLWGAEGSHRTCFGANGLADTVIDRCRMDGGTATGLSSCVSWYTQPRVDRCTLTDSLIEGSSAAVVATILGEDLSNTTDLTVTGNIFGRGYARFCCSGGVNSSWPTTQASCVWSNNTWGARGPFWQSGDPEEGATISEPGT
jgi:hypothetical protein